MRLLELFAGTSSISHAFAERGFETTTLDSSRIYSPDILIDIMTWEYDAYPPGFFDVIWASPPCTEYSRVKRGPRNLEGADAIVKRTLEILCYFKPRLWFIENPATGLLPKRDFMQGIHFRDVSYCKYGKPYRKNTRIWTNIGDRWLSQPICRRDCESMDGTRHIATAQKGPERDGRGGNFTRHELYAVPTRLCEELANACVLFLAQADARDG